MMWEKNHNEKFLKFYSEIYLQDEKIKVLGISREYRIHER
jgi:hypothetical protein